MIEISLTSLVGRKERFHWLGFGVSPSCDKCGGHRLAATGEFEERLEAVVREASQSGAPRSLGEEREPKPILFIDQIHLLLGAGSASGSMDAANILKPALARGAIRVIGATTIREYRQTIEKDGAWVGRDRRARPLVRPHGRCACVANETNTNRPSHQRRSLLHFTLGGSQGGARPPSPTAAVEWSVRYLADFRLPDKALDLVDQACAQVRFATLSPQKRRDRLSLPRAGTGSPSHHLMVGRNEIAAAAVAARCGIPVGTLTADEGVRLMALERDLGKRVKG